MIKVVIENLVQKNIRWFKRCVNLQEAVNKYMGNDMPCNKCRSYEER